MKSSRLGNFDIFLLVGSACALLSGTITPLFSLFFGEITGSFGLENVEDAANNAVLKLVYLSVGAAVVSAIDRIFTAKSALRRSSNLRVNILRNSLSMPIDWHRKSPEIVTELLTRKIPAACDGLGIHLSCFLRSLVTTSFGLGVSLFVDAYLTGLILSCILPSLLCINLALKLLSRRLIKRRDLADGRANSIVSDAFRHISSVHELNIEDIFARKYANVLSSSSHTNTRLGFISAVCEAALTNLVFCLAYGLVVWQGGDRVFKGTSKPGDVITVLFASLNAGYNAGLCVPAFNKVADGFRALKQIDASVSLVDNFGRAESEDCEILAAGEIELRNLTFGYPGIPEKTLHNVSFVIQNKQRVAIVGPSGSGKSTLFQLLLKHYDTTSSVFVDGVDLANWTTRSWLEAVSLVPQENVIFAASVFENVTCGREYTLQEVVSACRKADCGFIDKLKNGYETILCSTSLSGGQRQRLGIARAFLKQRRVWLLDEWSSALDNASERVIGDALSQVNATMISIAHKESAIRLCERIIVLEDGRVVGDGSHIELARDNHVYKALLEISHLNDSENFDETVDWKPATLRASVLSRNSVRLSVIPDNLKETLMGAAPPTVAGQRFDTSEFEGDRRLSFLASAVSAVLGAQYAAFGVVLSGCVGGFIKGTTTDQYALGYAYIGIGSSVLMSVLFWCREHLVSSFDSNLRCRVFQDAITLSIAWQTANPWSSVLLLLAEIRAMGRALMGARLHTMKLTSSSIACLIAGFVSCPKLAAVVLSTFPLHVGIRGLQMIVESAHTMTDHIIDDSNDASIQAIKDVVAVRSLCYDDRVIERVSEELGVYETSQTRTGTYSALLSGASNFVSLNTVGLAIWFGTRLLVRGSVSVVDMLRAFLCLYFLLSYDLLLLPEVFQLRRSAWEIQSRVSEVLVDAKEDRDAQAITTHLLAVDGSITFESVTFGFPLSGRLVLKAFNLHVESKSSVALVGASGHGKSSLIALILRHYEPQGGQIMLDGVPFPQLSRAFLRSACAVVSQTPAIFDASVTDNILYGSGGRQVSFEDIVAACTAAGIHDTIMKFPKQYDTLLVEGSLSGGQRQRLGIARALLAPRPITLLDEPTAALDKESESHVQRSFEALMGKTTLIAVAHRLSTVQKFDKIAAIYRGRVLESGPHEDLIAMGGYYKHLWCLSL